MLGGSLSKAADPIIGLSSLLPVNGPNLRPRSTKKTLSMQDNAAPRLLVMLLGRK